MGKGLKSADFEIPYGYYLKLEYDYLRNKTHVPSSTDMRMLMSFSLLGKEKNGSLLGSLKAQKKVHKHELVSK